MELNATIKTKDKIINDLTSQLNVANKMTFATNRCHTFVESCKLVSISVKDYFVKFFESIASGRTDYENLLPTTIGLKQ